MFTKLAAYFRVWLVAPLFTGLLFGGFRSAAADFPADSPVADVLRQADADVQAVVETADDQRNFDNTVGAIDDLIARLYRDAAFEWFMSIVSTDADQRERGRQASNDLDDWFVNLMKREDLYRAVQAYAQTKPKLEGERARLLDELLLEFRRAGMDLSEEKRLRMKELELTLNELKSEFRQTIQDDDSRILVTKDELKGMPDAYIGALEKAGELLVISMDYPTALPILQSCEVEATRQKVLFAFRRRGGKKNVETLEKVLKKRAEIAKLMGYDHWADYVLEDRMAKDAQTVAKFYEDLQPRVRRKAEADYQEFVAAKREHTGDENSELYPWDYGFYKNRLSETKYAVDNEKLREYFPLERVTKGLFEVTQRIYGLEYREATERASEKGLPIWHEDVRLYEVFDKSSGERLGDFYIDLHPREGKYSHAAKFGIYYHKVWPDGSVQKPLCALVCNFTKPTEDKPALLYHREVVTYFHEFGHCLHHILAQAHYSWFSGTSVSRDFVEAPSQMFENWVWDAEVLNLFARHYKTGEPVPPELLDGLVKARTLGSGIQTENQILYALADHHYHTSPDGAVDTTAVFHRLRKELTIFDPLPHTYVQAGFGHLMGYDAAYYSYLWSLVYAQDMYQHFRQSGMLNPEAGRLYRDKVLARGGTMDEMEMLKDYLGREPQQDAFLERLGLTE